MRYSGLFFSLLIMIFFTGCNNAQKIIQKEYKYEKTALGNHLFIFDIHLENIGNSGKIYNLVNKLIYDNRNFDEYAEYRERNFIGDSGDAGYPSGTEYDYQSGLTEKYSIVFNSGTHIIFQYNSYVYTSVAAHGNSFVKYFIIDLNEQRILEIADLIYPIPDDLLKTIIESSYNDIHYLRENIWPPDTINFSNGNIELMWNTYTITPYAVGTILIEIQDKTIEQYLTEKGKMLSKITALK